MQSGVLKRSVIIDGRNTSVSLEDAFWEGLKDIAARRCLTMSEIVGAIDSDRNHANLSSAVRLFVLDHYRSRHTARSPIRDLSANAHPNSAHLDLEIP